MALLKMCRCGKLIPYELRYCEDCQDKENKREAARHRDYKNLREDSEEQRFYTDSRWKRVRYRVKTRDKGLCLMCFSKSIVKYMDTVHHIDELKEDMGKGLSMDNCISLCESCHQKVHREYRTGNKMKMKNTLRELITRGRSEKY